MLISESSKGLECDVYRLNDNIIASGTIKTILQDAVIISGKNIVPLKPQTLIKLVIHSEKNHADVLVGLVDNATEDYIRIHKLQRFKDFNKREYFRLNVMINSRIQLRNTKGELTDRVILVKVRDLSLRGIFFIARENDLLPGQQLDILLPLNDTYSYTCTIRRKVDYYRSVGYGCSFDELDSKQEDFLCNYLFAQQRKEIMRAKRD